MTSGNQFQHGRWPIGLASPSGFRWGRLLTGLFAVAVSLATTWRPGTMPGELARADAPASQRRPAAAAAPWGERTTHGPEGALTHQGASRMNAQISAKPQAVFLGANRVLQAKPGAGPGAVQGDATLNRSARPHNQRHAGRAESTRS